MLSAYNQELEKKFNTLDGLPPNPKNYTWICPICNETVSHIKRSYTNRISHFRHHIESNCSPEPETEAHLAMKQFFYKFIPKYNDLVLKELEYWLEDQVADVYFEFKTGEKVAIECQNSPISIEKFNERNKKYTKKNIYVLWILNGMIEQKLKSRAEELRIDYSSL